jgi:two-component system, NarL family, response regulator LiaR
MIAANSIQKWGSILLYGLSLGLLLAALEFSKLRFIGLKNAEPWYLGAVAAAFALLGIWAGRKLVQKPPRAAENGSNPKDLTSKKAVLDKMNITPRELEVLALMAEGLSNQEIADRLFVSLNTVKTHASNVFSKLDAQRRTQAIQRAKDLGLLP